MVEKITTYQFSKRFKKEYNRLPKKNPKKPSMKKLTPLFRKKYLTPRSKIKRIQGTKNRWRDLLP